MLHILREVISTFDVEKCIQHCLYSWFLDIQYRRLQQQSRIIIIAYILTLKMSEILFTYGLKHHYCIAYRSS